MKLTKKQSDRLANLLNTTRKSLKHKTPSQQLEIWRIYNEKKDFLLDLFREENETRKQKVKQKTEAKKAAKKEKEKAKKAAKKEKRKRKESQSFNKPYFKKELKSGYYKLFEIKSNPDLLLNKEEVDKCFTFFANKKNVRYLHLVIDYVDPDTEGVHVISDVYTPFKVKQNIKLNISTFESFIEKYNTVRRDKKSDFEINTVIRIIMKVIYEKPKTR